MEGQKERVEVVSCKRCAEEDYDHAKDGCRKEEGEDEREKSWLEFPSQNIANSEAAMRLTTSLAPMSCSDLTGFLLWPGLCAGADELWPFDGRHTTQ